MNRIFTLWVEGYYDRYYYKHKKLVPMVGVHTPSYLNGTDEVVHFVNSIGFALNNK